MTAKTILACLTTEAHAAPVLKAAAALAEKTGAHVIGLHTLQALIVYPGVAMHIPDGIYEAFDKEQKEINARLEAQFVEAMSAQDFPSEWRSLQTQSAAAADRIVESARAADLVIMAQADQREDRTDQRNLQERVIRESGCPVMVVPHDFAADTLGTGIVLGWSGTREAARSAHDVAAVFPGTNATIVSAQKTTGDEMRASSTIAMAEYLARQGFQTEIKHRDLAGQAVADVLHEEATRTGADVIAVGAFGHSAIYDFVIGAATQELLRNARMPVMFSK